MAKSMAHKRDSLTAMPPIPWMPMVITGVRRKRWFHQTHMTHKSRNPTR